MSVRWRLVGVAVGDGDAEGWASGLGGILRVGLGGLGGVVVSPEPDHFFGELGGSLGLAVRADSEAEAEVVGLELEGVGHTDVCERPATVAVVLLIVVAVLNPDADVAVWFAENLFGIVLAAVGDGGVFVPLDAGEAADPGDDATELVGHLPAALKEAIPPEEEPVMAWL